MNLWKAQARTAYSSGSIEVRRQGEGTNRVISMGRHLSAAVAGDWVLVAEDSGACWGLMLLGTGASAYPSNPTIDGSVPTSGTMTAPPAWTGYFTHGGGTVTSAEKWYFGRYRLSTGYVDPTTYEWVWISPPIIDELHDAISVYLGLAGLTITSGSAQIVAPSAAASTTAKLVLYSAPTSIPANSSGITQLATVAAPTLPTPAAGTSVALPAAWLTQLAAGTANAIGMLDAATSSAPNVSTSTAAVPSLSIVYS